MNQVRTPWAREERKTWTGQPAETCRGFLFVLEDLADDLPRAFFSGHSPPQHYGKEIQRHNPRKIWHIKIEIREKFAMPQKALKKGTANRE